MAFRTLLGAVVIFLAILSLQAAENKTSPNVVTVDASKRFQVMDGFGLNFTAPYFRDDQKPMFDMFIDDLGVTMFRIVRSKC
jgi:O-glycosyl hydrolase